MRDVIFSMFIPSQQDSDVLHQWRDNTKVDYVREKQKQYAEAIGADYQFFTDVVYYDERFTDYENINFMKFVWLERLAKHYDRIVYLDADVIPNNNDNIFEQTYLGEPLLTGAWFKDQTEAAKATKYPSARCPLTKYSNLEAALFLYDPHAYWDIGVINTGIIAASCRDIEELDYFGPHFDKAIALLEEVKYYSPVSDRRAQQHFAFDNEVVLALNYAIRDVPASWNGLPNKMHYIVKQQSDLDNMPEGTTMIHYINKDLISEK